VKIIRYLEQLVVLKFGKISEAKTGQKAHYKHSEETRSKISFSMPNSKKNRSP
jgi:hypothetical protein